MSDGDAALAAADLVLLPAERLDRIMGRDLAYRVSLVADWMNRVGRTADVPDWHIATLCDMLLALGLPLDRYASSTDVLDAEHDSVSRVWVRGLGVTMRSHVHGDGDTSYRSSPFHEATQSGRAVELHLDRGDGTRFDVAADLRSEDYTHYLCLPVTLISGGRGWVTFATKRAGGFAASDMAVMGRLTPPLAMVLDLRSTWRSLDKLLRTYVGDEPHRAILRGNTRRGQVTTIRSAILFADMRDSMGHTAHLEAVEAVGVFNALFDCLVPPIESRGGEVLKFMGDGLLAIFRESQGGAGEAAARALEAGQEGLRRLGVRNLARPGERPIEAGVALHYGEAAYGNIGSELRLDFTVIGKDVGLASRIANLNRPLGEPVLMSRDFAERSPGSSTLIGSFELRGFAAPFEVFCPSAVVQPPGDASGSERTSEAEPGSAARRSPAPR